MKLPIEKSEYKKWKKIFNNEDLINLYKGLLVKPEFAKEYLHKICKYPQYKNLKSCKNLKEQTSKITKIIFPQSIIDKITSPLDKLYKVIEILYFFKFKIENSTIKITGMFTPQYLERYFENSEEVFTGMRFYRYYIIDNTVVSAHNHPYFKYDGFLEKRTNPDSFFLPSNEDVLNIGDLLIEQEINNYIEIIITHIDKYITPFAKYKKSEILPKHFEKYPQNIPCYKFEGKYFYFWITASLFTRNSYPKFQILNIEID